MDNTTLRRVNLRHTVEAAAGPVDFNMIFEEMDAASPPSAASYGVTDPKQAETLHAAVQAFAQANDAFFAWLEADAKHAILLAEDPVGALRAACPDFDMKVIQDLAPIFASSNKTP